MSTNHRVVGISIVIEGGVLNFLQSRYNRLDLSVNVGEGQITEQEYGDKVKGAFRQMGIEIK